MFNRILDFSENPVFVRTRLGQLVIEAEGRQALSVPLDEIAVMVLAHPHATFTAAALGQSAQCGAVAVFCDEKRQPAGMLLPLQTHCTQQERMLAQSEAKLPLKKRAWQQVIQAKLRSQARVLEELRGSDFGVRQMAASVRSGDPENLEARAAQRYWPRLFGDASFRRNREGGGRNAALNYGYAVLRAVVARAICAAGLHPSLGLHHSNRYDSFCLADDLMEPYRTLVDRAVAQLPEPSGDGCDHATKTEIVGGLTRRFHCDGEERTLFEWLSVATSSLAQLYMGQVDKLCLPEFSDVSASKKPVGVSFDVALRDVRSAG